MRSEVLGTVASSRDILRGTFRLSIVVAVVAAAYTSFKDWSASADRYQSEQDKGTKEKSRAGGK
jgi:hypothetical protein